MAPTHSEIDGPPWTQEDWSSFLADELGRPVEVRFGTARRHVIVAREEERALTVRMNAVFGAAPDRVRTAAATWLRSGKRARRACDELDRWIEEQAETIGAPRARRVRVRSDGEHHDLDALARELLEGELRGEPFPLGRPRISWGRRSRRGRRRTLLLGSFDPQTNLVRVHPCLDQAAVPAFFVRYILFHELLHAIQPTRRPERGRAVHHPPEFRAREARYPDYGRAIAWQEEHLGRLLESVRTGRPIRLRRSERTSAPEVPRAVGPERRSWSGLVQGLLFGDGPRTR